MLLFEFFPAFVALVCIVAGVSLFMMNLEADETDGPQDRSTPSRQTGASSNCDKAAAIGFIAIVLGASAANAQTRTTAAARAAEVSGSLEATARLAAPAVVEIFATSYRPGEGTVARQADLVATERASGSGVIVDVCRADGMFFDAGELPAIIDFVMQGGLERAAKRDAERKQEEARRVRLQKLREDEKPHTVHGDRANALIEFLWSLFD